MDLAGGLAWRRSSSPSSNFYRLIRPIRSNNSLRPRRKALFVDNLRRSVLHTSILENRLDFCKLLLSDRTDPDYKDTLGNTSLHLAAKAGKLEFVKVLLKANATPNLRNLDGDSAIDLSVRYGYLDVAYQLLIAGARPLEDGNGFLSIKSLKNASTEEEDRRLESEEDRIVKFKENQDAIKSMNDCAKLVWQARTNGMSCKLCGLAVNRALYFRFFRRLLNTKERAEGRSVLLSLPTDIWKTIIFDFLVPDTYKAVVHVGFS